MTVDDLLSRLFPEGHAVRTDGLMLAGGATVDGAEVAVLGTCDHAAIGADLALQLAAEVLAVVRDNPGRPLVLLVDTCGQKMSRRDETLGLNTFIAHLAKCLDLARRRGHPVLALVHGQAVSAGFLATGLMADACHALPDTHLGVMALPAMARITRLPLERLETLARTSPVFAPGSANYHAMGAVETILHGDLASELAQALAGLAQGPDPRRVLGAARGGRLMAAAVADRLVQDATA